MVTSTKKETKEVGGRVKKVRERKKANVADSE